MTARSEDSLYRFHTRHCSVAISSRASRVSRRPPCVSLGYLRIRRQRKPITISVYKHCFLEESRVSGCMHRAHQDVMPLSFGLSSLRLSLGLSHFPSTLASPLLKSLADTSCMSPSCKRGVTRLTSIVLVDGHAYRAPDRWAGDDKGPRARGHRDGHALRCPGSHRRYHQPPRNNARALTSDCTMPDWNGRGSRSCPPFPHFSLLEKA